MWNGVRKHFTLWCFAHTGCPLWQTQSWKFPLIKDSSPKKCPRRWRLRERWDLKSYWKGLEAHPKIFFFKCLWLTCLDKENYADCLDMQGLLATSFSFIWVFSLKGGTDSGHGQCHDERGHFSSLPFIHFPVWIQGIWKSSSKRLQGNYSDMS